MKIRFLFYLVIIFASSTTVFTQALKIVSKKVAYTRPTVKSDHALGAKTFIIVYPKISGANGKSIENLLSYEKAFDFKLVNEFEAKRGLQRAGYRILYNADNILSVRLSIDAYTFSDLHYSKFITINTKTAELVDPGDVFKNLNGLAAKCRKSQLKAINIAKKHFSPDDYGDVYNLINFTTEELNGFTISRKGVTFHDPNRFGRTAIMYEPNRDYFFGWNQLKPFIKRDGLLGRFIR